MTKERQDAWWLIWSIEHQAWWAPNHQGYVHERKRAGLYFYGDAIKIVQGANIHLNDEPNEAMILAEPEDLEGRS